jgi:hypothetical protein
MRRRGRAVLPALAILTALAVAGCGQSDFANDPRPAPPLEITVKISDDGVLVSPRDFGAGLVNFTIANLSQDRATLVIDGPTPAQSDEMPAGGNTLLKADMRPGSYQLSAEGPPNVAPFLLQVGSDRPSGSNDLLLP